MSTVPCVRADNVGQAQTKRFWPDPMFEHNQSLNIANTDEMSTRVRISRDPIYNDHRTQSKVRIRLAPRQK